ncbi:hypothetical protein AAFF_G00440550 [Aldrovandia affinis]|uniref:Uncharacterized protein n=1 Tax=Aldrovandia affinis TaxID=143900 RepID=A0AAD7S9G8_9TELE|nr:hypothetical protein AAFF_G00440550 [Aldrovandia affinis]
MPFVSGKRENGGSSVLCGPVAPSALPLIDASQGGTFIAHQPAHAPRPYINVTGVKYAPIRGEHASAAPCRPGSGASQCASGVLALPQATRHSAAAVRALRCP